MALGKILRETREQQGHSVAQVAEATHMMTQVVEELEREDFHRIAAPIYGRGFVKLYAEFLRIDAEPLVQEFNEIYLGARRPVVATRVVKTAPEPARARQPAARSTPLVAPAPAATVQPAATSAPVATPSAATPAPEDDKIVAAPLLAEPASPGGASDVAEALDDLFGPLPASARVARPGGKSARGLRDSTPAPVATPWQSAGVTGTYGQGAQRSTWTVAGTWCRQAVGTIACGWHQFVRRLGGSIPAGWRNGPVLIGVGVALLAVVICVVIITIVARRPVSAVASATEAPVPVTAVEAAAVAPLNITAILPPPEPYLD